MPYTMNGQHPVAWGSVDHPGYSSNARQKESGSLVDEGTLAPMLSSTSMLAIAAAWMLFDVARRHLGKQYWAGDSAPPNY
ncbi:hypothetical protein F9C07_10183 [Aspergillus flavus]|uniref:Uncharacterized protein n=1 Tax=Aspergillus flavus (strain ATCC 200026 / FGSC A1120 / IAM 13836 / NRRL 3357 / JCM 12722 / SRRC 167) TaxID=332952 RepID=A0A7U2QZX3_ASPFN|nr:hypothetical protein F9C07_10183 [Aspergillus flavus]